LDKPRTKAALVATERYPHLMTIWELIMFWAMGASVAVTAMLVVLAIIFSVSRKLD
jgi:hypothetical protein